uniref:26S proteasome regulatory subunit 8 n=1 Tax=Anser brachyrhynchus TaxID=132585 RepID=A0A8B9I778_9AVES
MADKHRPGRKTTAHAHSSQPPPPHRACASRPPRGVPMGRRRRMRSAAPLCPERACALPTLPTLLLSRAGGGLAGAAGGEEVTLARRARGGVADGSGPAAIFGAGRGGGGGPMPAEKMAVDGPEQLIVNEKSQNLRRLQAQRNELNAKVRLLREELQLLQEQGSYVGEVVRAMDKKKVLVKVHPEGKFVVDVDKNIDINDVTPNCRVALRNDSYTLHKILPNKVDPLVSLMMVEKVPDSTYEMIGGLDKQIKEIKEVIELPVKHPELFEALGIAQPKGVLLYGPPGTGKTLLARAVAHHTDCTFIRVSGSELVQKFIGEGARMVRELFVMAREHAPSIIFMDEIDSIGSSRLEGGSGGDSEVQRTMLELLNQLDGFEATKNIKVIMATNRIDILDSALLRPGRIDRKIEFPPPNEEARLDILKIHSRKMNLTRGINLRKIAELMPGASGAEVKGVCTEAGMYALRERRVHVTQEDFEMAVAKVGVAGLLRPRCRWAQTDPGSISAALGLKGSTGGRGGGVEGDGAWF